jgi:phosphoenolpyruvate synthase/pyruvate phosphate dikinase
LASAPNIDNLVELEVASLRVRELIEQAPMERAFEGALRDAYDELCFRHSDVSLAVAVRSSAAGEDAATASFAGQYESYLGVIGADAVLTAVRRAWSSLFVARALTYRARQKQHFRETPMGVGVLRLVHARCAGVAFSAHPVSGKRDRFVIEASWGWGDSVVQARSNLIASRLIAVMAESFPVALATNVSHRYSIRRAAASPNSRCRRASSDRSVSRLK